MRTIASSVEIADGQVRVGIEDVVDAVENQRILHCDGINEHGTEKIIVLEMVSLCPMISLVYWKKHHERPQIRDPNPLPLK